MEQFHSFWIEMVKSYETRQRKTSSQNRVIFLILSLSPWFPEINWREEPWVHSSDRPEPFLSVIYLMSRTQAISSVSGTNIEWVQIAYCAWLDHASISIYDGTKRFCARKENERLINCPFQSENNLLVVAANKKSWLSFSCLNEKFKYYFQVK